MIETEEQRRWWFATHPEYSSSRRGVGGGSDRGQNEDKVDPKEVDAYVDEALKYENGPVADLLKSVKRNFGTEGDSRIGGQSQAISEGRSEEGWVSLTGYHADGGAFMPRLPTTEELSRLPREMVREFFRRLDTLLQNNPLIIDPNALERHHGLSKEFINYFLDCGLNIEEFIIIMRAADHRLKPDGLHTGKGRRGDWNEEWRQFIKQYSAKNTPEHRERVRNKFNEMINKYGIDEKAILSPTIPKR
jgi:Predicted lipoprotein of unknown function (DUF2380)